MARQDITFHGYLDLFTTRERDAYFEIALRHQARKFANEVKDSKRRRRRQPRLVVVRDGEADEGVSDFVCEQ